MESGLKGKVYRLAALVAESVGQRRSRLRATALAFAGEGAELAQLGADLSSEQVVNCAPTGREDFA